MTRSAAEKSALESSLAAAQEENEKLRADFDKLQQNLNMSKEEIQTLSASIKENNQKIAALQSAIKEAFQTYNPDDITVQEKNGKLYITMSNSILFDSGRDKLTKASSQVIATLAGVLNNNPDLKIMVEGHTDNEPVRVHKATYGDNWGLSVARSLAVVREMEKNGVNPARLFASGKGETEPVASNDTEEGRTKNRRTEFIVVPKIDGLYRMVKEDFANVGGTN
ncbi:MAG: hypothetical protein OHK0039_18920 [Bacteroidia bacterium]